MRKTLAVLVSIAFFGAALTVPAFAVVKAGATCSKAGLTSTVSGKKYTCVKSSKKLLWDKGVVIETKIAQIAPIPKMELAPSPTASPSLSNDPEKLDFVPWSTSFTSNQMTNTALEDTDQFFGKVTPNNNYELTISPEISKSDLQWITKMLDYATGAFVSIHRDKTRVFLGTTREWSAATLRSANTWIGNPDDLFPCSQGLDDAYCSDRNLILLIFTSINSRYFTWDVGRRSTPAHEFFHTIQAALVGSTGSVGPENPRHIPRWLMEGSANYFGYYLSDRLGFEKYLLGRNSEVTLPSAYRNIMPLDSYDNYYSNPYGIGQAATEYLIASIGFEKFLNIWRFTNSEQSFQSGFNKATGIAISDFYLKFENARASMKIGPS